MQCACARPSSTPPRGRSSPAPAHARSPKERDGSSSRTSARGLGLVAMARWRPPPLVADSLLAIVLAVASLAVADNGRAGNDTRVAQPVDWSLATPPEHPRPGQVWNADIELLSKSP